MKSGKYGDFRSVGRNQAIDLAALQAMQEDFEEQSDFEKRQNRKKLLARQGDREEQRDPFKPR